MQRQSTNVVRVEAGRARWWTFHSRMAEWSIAVSLNAGSWCWDTRCCHSWIRHSTPNVSQMHPFFIVCKRAQLTRMSSTKWGAEVGNMNPFWYVHLWLCANPGLRAYWIITLSRSMPGRHHGQSLRLLFIHKTLLLTAASNIEHCWGGTAINKCTLPTWRYDVYLDLIFY